MANNAKVIHNLKKFRKNIGVESSSNLLSYIFEGKHRVVEENSPLAGVVEYLKPYVKHLLVGDWVKYIAITGSYACGNTKDGDDIDLFIVVKNGRLWWYRGLLTIHPVISSLMRKADGSAEYSGKLCINLIAQENGLEFDSDIFTFHELFLMYPIYNEGYRDTILRNNLWIKEFGGYIDSSRGNTESPSKRTSLFWRLLDISAFIPQIIFMIVMGHNPNIKRLLKSYKKGRIEFFPHDFKKDKLDLYNQSK